VSKGAYALTGKLQHVRAFRLKVSRKLAAYRFYGAGPSRWNCGTRSIG
jgi:hypothetical protein